MDFKQYLTEHYKLSEADWKTSMDLHNMISYKAKDFFLRTGEIANGLGIVISGLFRTYTENDDGEEITLEFNEPNTVLISIESYNDRTPAKETIVAMDDSELLHISYDDMLRLYDLVPQWPVICKDVSDFKNNKARQRLLDFQTLSAAERYAKFCKERPFVIQKSPLKHIASYLGIDIATLSRIRGKKTV